jgi:endonuclease/exonuclease/phosphatase family metal-dependent hydrolase
VLPRALLDDSPWRAAPVSRRARSLGWHGNALLVRKDIAIAHAEPLDLPTLEPRGAVCADLLVEGRPIRVLGMHLDLSGLLRREQIRAILRHCRGCEPACPTVLLGDFNQWGRTTGAFREFAADWHVPSIGNSFPSRRPIAPLDRIVHSREWACGQAGVHHSALAVVASDHLPIRARWSLLRQVYNAQIIGILHKIRAFRGPIDPVGSPQAASFRASCDWHACC